MQDIFQSTFKSSERVAELEHKMVNRAFRVDANILQKLNVQEIHDGKVSPLAVTDISTSGIAVRASSLKELPKIGDQLQFRFLIGDLELSANVFVRRITDKTIGCQYGEGKEKIREALFSTYHPEIIAASMYQVNSRASFLEPGEESRWFTGDNSSELFFQLNDQGVLLKVSLVFLGNYFRFPTVNEESDESMDTLQYGISAIEGEVEWQDKVPGPVRDFAVRVIRQMNELNYEDRQKLLEVFGEPADIT